MRRWVSDPLKTLPFLNTFDDRNNRGVSTAHIEPRFISHSVELADQEASIDYAVYYGHRQPANGNHWPPGKWAGV